MKIHAKVEFGVKAEYVYESTFKKNPRSNYEGKELMSHITKKIPQFTG